MAFIRFIGCSVGQGVCTHCDTDFDRIYPELGGGMFTADELFSFCSPYPHICLTGGEPLDRDLDSLSNTFADGEVQKLHIETSGTRPIPQWVKDGQSCDFTWLTVSPKPHYRAEAIIYADEIKVIIPSLGEGEGWPTLENAVNWAKEGRLVYLQPRNHKFTPDHDLLSECRDLVEQHPTLKLSTQFHKFIQVR